MSSQFVSMLQGDGVITPAVSVVSAVEGLQVAASGVTRSVQSTPTL